MGRLSVTGEGKVLAEPDILEVQCVVEGFDKKNSKAARAEQEKKMGFILDALESEPLALPAKDISTPRGGYRSGEKWEWDEKQKKQVMLGYQVTQQLRIKVPVEKGSALLEMLGEAATINGNQFALSNLDELKEEAVQKAIANAQERARKYAAQLGSVLGKVITCTTDRAGVSGGRQRGGYALMAVRSANAESHPELPAGEEEVSATVSVTYKLKK